MNRNERRRQAEDTLKIVERGHYTNPAGVRMNISSEIDAAVRGTTLYTPAELAALVAQKIEPGRFQTVFEVENETTLSAARRLAVDRRLDDVLVLNFASAKNAGGGFLGGSQAQEESLARSAALYETLNAVPEYYKRNRACRSLLYTDHMILSPGVPVFRDDSGDLLDEPYGVSFLTAPAVNAGALLEKRPSASSHIRPTMARRIEMVLALAAAEGYRHLVLGAWGCGVFRNEPEDIAELFASLLTGDGRFAQHFETVVFAVLSRGHEEAIIRPFRARFANVPFVAHQASEERPGGMS